jgi:5-methylcytosine-specific restriction endonuclease McrA
VTTRTCRDCPAPIGRCQQRCEPCRIANRAAKMKGWASRICTSCGGTSRAKGGQCINCYSKARRTLVPCPRCGVEFWPWASGKHARKRCDTCIEQQRITAQQRRAQPKPPTRPRLTAEERQAKQRSRSKAYYYQNKERAMAVRSEYRRRRVKVDPGFRQAIRNHNKAWAAKHPEQARLLRRQMRLTRDARKRNAYVEAVNPQVVYDRDQGICGICRLPVDRTEQWHVDHIIPLARGGEHSYANTQLAHGLCNSIKSDRIQPPPEEGGGGRIGSSARTSPDG